MVRRQNDLGKDDIKLLVRRLAIPSMLAQFVNVLYSIVDRMYIGNIPQGHSHTRLRVINRFCLILLSLFFRIPVTYCQLRLFFRAQYLRMHFKIQHAVSIDFLCLPGSHGSAGPPERDHCLSISYGHIRSDI